MPKPSIYQQLDAIQVAGPLLPLSPRHFNPSLIRFKGRLWMSVRYHLGREHASRCATGIVALDPKTMQPVGKTQHLNFPSTVGDEHYEDARLFMFDGHVHVSVTVMSGYVPGKNYSCVIKYARLKLRGTTWSIDEVFWPKYGNNNGNAKEKNWAFFEHAGALYCVYSDNPERKVLKIDGDRVTAVYDSPAASWPWGVMRGGTSPIPYGNGKMLAVFHSSLPTEEAPHFVRYYGGAYVFEDKPPFKILLISSKPIMAGSEADGHGIDPRYSEGWKPYVVFPCGCVPDEDGWLVSLGVNDWQCAVGRITAADLSLIEPDRSNAPIRYFRTANGSVGVQLVTADGNLSWINWERCGTDPRGCMVPPGYFATSDGRIAEAMESAPRSTEITADEYFAAMRKTA